MPNMLVRNRMIVDGTGREEFRGSVHPDTIADNTTVNETARRPTGIEKVYINGELVVEKGVYLV